MPQVATADILRRATPGSGTPLEAILRLLAQRAQPGVGGFPEGSPAGRELSSQRLGNLADLTAQIFGRTPQEATAFGAGDPAVPLPAVGTLRAITPGARGHINRFLEEVVPALRARLVSPSPRARAQQTLAPSEAAENVFDVAAVPQQMVQEIVDTLGGGTEVLGFQHGRIPAGHHGGLPPTLEEILARRGVPKTRPEISPGILFSEEKAAFTAPHELAHTIFPQLRPATVSRFVNKLAGPEGRRLFNKVVQDALETGSIDKANAAGYLHEFLSSIEDITRLERAGVAHEPAFAEAVNKMFYSASEVFARMFEGAIPPTSMIRKLMSEIGRKRVSERASEIASKRGATPDLPGFDVTQYLEDLMRTAP